MPQDLVIRFRQQFLTEKRIGHFPNVTAVHDASTLPCEVSASSPFGRLPAKTASAATSSERSCARPRWRRDITVPIGIANASAASLYGQILDVAEENDLLERRRQPLQAAQHEFVGQILRHRRDKRHRLRDAVVGIAHHDRSAFRPTPVADDRAAGWWSARRDSSSQAGSDGTTAAPASSFPARHPRHPRGSARTTWRGGTGGRHAATPLPRTQPRRLIRAERSLSPSIPNTASSAQRTGPAPHNPLNHHTIGKYSRPSKARPSRLGLGRHFPRV